MNKQIISLAAVAAMAGAALAVESQNVVGYQTVTLKPQAYAMIGVPFDGIGTNGISVQDLVATNGLVGAAGAANADSLWYYDPSEAGGYIKLYLYNSTLTSAQAQQRKGKWLMSAKPTTAANQAEWGNSGNVISTKILKPGMGLWLIRKNASTPLELKFSGQVIVAEGGSNSIAIREGYNMVAGSFSTDFPLNVVESGAGDTDIDWLAKGCVGGAGAAQADSIWWYDEDESGGYVKTYLYNSTLTSSAAQQRKNKWLMSAKPTDATNQSEWGNNGNVVCKKKIPAGRGFWYIRKTGAGAFTLVLDQPYTLD